MTPELALLILAWVVIALLALAMGGLLAQVRELRVAIALDPGRPTIGRSLAADVAGHFLETSGLPVVALFVSADCPVCAEVVPSVAQGLADNGRPGPPDVLVGNADAAGEYRDAVPGVPFITVDTKTLSRIGIAGFPWILAVDDQGSVTYDQPAGPLHRTNDRLRRASMSLLEGSEERV